MRGTKKSKLAVEELQSRSSPVSSRLPLDTRSINEQQAILNLSQLASTAVDFHSVDKTSTLVKALIVSFFPQISIQMTSALTLIETVSGTRECSHIDGTSRC